MSNKKILIVSEDKTSVDLLLKMIKTCNHEAEPAYKGMEALEKIQKGNFNLLLLDIKLPDISGTDVVKNIRNFNKKIKIVLISGYPEFQNAVDTLDYEINEILLKPISQNELIRVCNQYLLDES